MPPNVKQSFRFFFFLCSIYSALFISILYTFYNYYNGLFAGNGSVGSVGRSVNRIKKPPGFGGSFDEER